MSEGLPDQVHETIRLIGRKWASQVLYELTINPLSFGELKNTVKGISASVLSDLLTTFIESDIVEKRVMSVSPQRSSYFITDFGAVLCEIIEKIMNWGEELIARNSKKLNITKE